MCPINGPCLSIRRWMSGEGNSKTRSWPPRLYTQHRCPLLDQSVYQQHLSILLGGGEHFEINERKVVSSQTAQILSLAMYFFEGH